MEEVRGYSISGNAIFNWGVAPKMQWGIREGRSCFQNAIAANDANCFRDGVIPSEGRDSVARDNIGFADKPHEGKPEEVLQSFRQELTACFIGMQLGGDEGSKRKICDPWKEKTGMNSEKDVK